MTAVDYFISGDHEQARGVLAGVLRAQGFEVATAPGGWSVTRGSTSSTVWLGAFAGKNQRLEYSMQFFEHEGQLVARLNRDSGAGAMGGVIGVARSSDVFAELDQALGSELTRLALLTNVAHFA